MRLANVHIWIVYVTSLTAACLLKVGFHDWPVEALKWLLWPTAKLTAIISGESFVWIKSTGYSSWFQEQTRYLIDKSCAGLNFFVLALLLMVFTRVRGPLGKLQTYGRFGICVGAAYLATLVANSLRISLAIFLENISLVATYAREFHREQGMFIYLLCLITVYFLSQRNTIFIGAKNAKTL